MNKKPLVLVSSGKSAPVNYVEALAAVGADSEAVYLPSPDASLYDALLLTGGGDVEPFRYGRENTASVNMDGKRDEAELDVIKAFIDAGKPILGICRGHQVINVALGGTLIQHLPNAELHSGDPELTHEVITKDGSILFRLYGEKFISNTSHHQAVEIPAPGMIPMAWSENGAVAEGCQHESLPIFSVQFHPERMRSEKIKAKTADGLLIFAEFVRMIGENKQ